jgi:hypothetical protein
MEKSQDRLNILKKIDEYELKGWFSKDVEKRLYKNKLRLMSRFLPNKI